MFLKQIIFLTLKYAEKYTSGWINTYKVRVCIRQALFFLGLPLSKPIDRQLSDDKLQMTTEAMKIHTMDWAILDFNRL